MASHCTATLWRDLLKIMTNKTKLGPRYGEFILDGGAKGEMWGESYFSVVGLIVTISIL
jgi:hypothetical protein